ncbi:QcrA and Rieske domain-containing protein [Agromyces aerolatus]|uniref:QcrA and Rieske domain-containing protein n=1 Tax=Agromyces sp. LY-1074 TaxID=3074080 RepID=UPI002856B557|nr:MULTISPECIES: Rieske (2Fe-2S) protein [unclassified Agromyces]MDR5699882.1 Rieske (2Fe-2S) protein [Agromyces sp. LY-1074]MDR5706306.1 Rieske (2Fe-2S) protein [Agromyces sp. LY-1358]
MARGTELSRRTMLVIGGTGAAAGALTLAGCGPGGETDAPATTDASGVPPASEGGGSAAAGGEIAALSEVPVGGSVGVEIDGDPALLAQPEAGQVVAFSAICTHQGCVVGAAGDRFECPCHGSVYDAATGDVLQGPAIDPLPPIEVRVEGDRIVAGA